MRNPVSVRHLSNEELDVQRHLLLLIKQADTPTEVEKYADVYGTFCHATRQLSEGLRLREGDEL